jgi:hypothetical protein
MTETERYVTIRLPLADWLQIVSDIESMCGTSADEIEILQDVKELSRD